jgi:poly(3-hydroxybutyrate) depolymerase
MTMRAALLATALLGLVTACGGSGPAAPEAQVPGLAERCPKSAVTRFEDKDFSSPRWQQPMLNYQLAGCDINGQVPGAPDNEPWWDTMDFWIYEAAGALANPEPMLVVYLHGTSQTPVEAALGIGWNELADREDIIVVYPHGRDPNNDNWEWGEASAFGRVGQLESVNQITTAVQALYGIGPDRTFIAGTSSGAISATMTAALYPDLFSGVMSVIGGSYNLSDPDGTQAYMAMGDKAKVMPAFLIHATADHLFPQNQSREADTQWAGTNDRADNGMADGSVSQIAEVDATHMDTTPQKAPAEDECLSRQDNNPCPSYPLGYETYPYEIHRYRDDFGAGQVIVEAWYLQFMAHNYPYGNAEGNFTDPAGPDVTTTGYQFFRDVVANRE